MGSYNVSCFLSGVNIEIGDVCYAIPIYRRKKRDDSYEEFDYPDVNYVPFTLPIKGIYDDYGNMANIERGCNIKFIEEKFGITIEEFLYNINSGHKDSFIKENTTKDNEEYMDVYKNLNIIYLDGDFIDGLIDLGSYDTNDLKSRISLNTKEGTLNIIQPKEHKNEYHRILDYFYKYVFGKKLLTESGIGYYGSIFNDLHRFNNPSKLYNQALLEPYFSDADADEIVKSTIVTTVMYDILYKFGRTISPHSFAPQYPHYKSLKRIMSHAWRVQGKKQVRAKLREKE